MISKDFATDHDQEWIVIVLIAAEIVVAAINIVVDLMVSMASLFLDWVLMVSQAGVE